MENLKIAVLDSATLGNDIKLDLFNDLGEVEIYSTSTTDEVIERVKNIDVCIINKVKLTRDVLVHAKNLKLICVAATGYDNIDTAYCKERGIAVCNVAGYSKNSVSQLTVAMVLSASVNLPAFRESVANGSYSKGKVQNILTPVYHEISGLTWGIIGYGGIGRQVGSVAKALGCKVVVNKRTPVDDEVCLPLDELLKVSDIITVHVPLTDETRNMIGEREVSLMKDGVILVNVARGAVFDEESVTKGVESGKIGFLGCDVYSVEPMPENYPYSRIKALDNVCLTPHMAWGAYEARVRCMEEIYQNIKSFQNGDTRNRIV
ncbi:MAG: hydroxyacid dehydrogenase [Clostridia bacterium]|nr:hydroxyacid dehydrogenase [Clostridia bacterium]